MVVTVHAGNTAAVPASEVEAIIRFQQTWPPPMEGSSRAVLATARPFCLIFQESYSVPPQVLNWHFVKVSG